MSGFEIVGVAAASLQIAQFVGETVLFLEEYKNAGEHYTQRLHELCSKLKNFQSVLEALTRAAETIESCKHRTPRESEALGRMKHHLDDSYTTLKTLLDYHGKLQKPAARSRLKLAVDYWFYKKEGRVVLDRGVTEIGDRLFALQVTLQCIQTEALYDMRNRPSSARTDSDSSTVSTTSTTSTASIASTASTASYASTACTTFSNDDETEPLCEPFKFKWNLELQTEEDAISYPSGLSDAIISAVRNKDSKAVASLLERGANPLAKDDNGWCAFHYAVRADSKRVMRELIQCKKVINNPEGVDQKTNNGATPLHFASSTGMKTMAKELLNAGADKNAVDNHNRSPLFVAVEKNRIDMVELLLDHRAISTPSPPSRFKEMQNTISNRKKILAKAKKG